MKLSNYKQLNTNEVKAQLTLALSADNENPEYPQDAERTRYKTYQESSISVCKQHLLKKALADPYGALMCWLNSKPATSTDAYNPRQLLPNPTQLWELYTTDLLARLENSTQDADKLQAYKEICYLAAAIDSQLGPIIESQQKIEWITTSQEYCKVMEPKIKHLLDYIYTTFIKQT